MATTFPTIESTQLANVTGGAGFDIGSLLSMGQQIAGSVGGAQGQQAAGIMGKVAPMIQQFMGGAGGGAAS
jgi:hypothetical protein